MFQPYDMPLEALKVYSPSLTRASDFQEFWDIGREEMHQHSRKSTQTLVDYPARQVALYRIQYEGFRGAIIGGWYARPKTDHRIPGLVVYHGYNWNYEGGIHETVNWALHGYATFHVSVRGQQGSGQSMPSPHGHVAGWMTQGILDPETYYYRAAYLDAMKAVEWLSEQSGVDPNRIGVTGGSQGGGLSLATASLSDIPRVAVANYPYLCHFRRAVDIAPAGPYGEITEFLRQNGDPEIETQVFHTLSYMDVMNLVPWMTSPVLVSVGLVDQLTPPSTIYATYHHIGSTQKDIRPYRYFGHEVIPQFETERLAFLARILAP